MRLNITCSESVVGSLLFKFDGTQTFTATATTTGKVIMVMFKHIILIGKYAFSTCWYVSIICRYL